MKNSFIFFMGIFFLIVHGQAAAQDSSRPGAAKKINKTSEQADNLQGKKIQQQTLLNTRVEQLGSSAANKPKKKRR